MTLAIFNLDLLDALADSVNEICLRLSCGHDARVPERSAQLILASMLSKIPHKVQVEVLRTMCASWQGDILSPYELASIITAIAYPTYIRSR